MPTAATKKPLRKKGAKPTSSTKPTPCSSEIPIEITNGIHGVTSKRAVFGAGDSPDKATPAAKARRNGATKSGSSPAKPSKRKAQVAGPLPQESLKPKDDIEVNPEVLAFIAALDQYKKIHSRMFPSWSEVLFVLKQLGYRKS